jgi:hypothetical protein
MKLILLLNAGDVAWGEALPFAGAKAVSVERGGDLTEGLDVEQLVDLAHYFCIGHPAFPGPQRIGQGNRSCSTTTKAHM